MNGPHATDLPGAALYRRHSAAFVQRWREVTAAVFCWRVRGRFVLVPTLPAGRRVASYLPHLSYTDLDADEAGRVIREEASPHRALVRVLLAPHEAGAPAPDEPVVMRLSLAGKSPDAIFAQDLSSGCRNRLRKAQKAGFTVAQGTGETLLRDAYGVFLDIMQRHGVPAWPLDYLRALCGAGLAECIVLYRNHAPVAMLVAVRDGPIAWVPWCGALAQVHPDSPNHLTHWTAIQWALQQGCEVFDFGRSPYGGGTFEFKRKWGATPVVVRMLSQQPLDLYGRYELASAVWRRLPRFVTTRLGPRLCRVLPEL